MIDYIPCKIDAIGYDFFKKKFTILLNINYKSTRCYISESILEFATKFYQNHDNVIAKIETRNKKLFVSNIRKAVED